MQAKWAYDMPGSYHASDCCCDQHCRNCYDDLPTIRAARDRLISSRAVPASERLGLRARHCSAYCRNRAKRERALDRYLNTAPLPTRETHP